MNATAAHSLLPQLLHEHEADILKEWIKHQLTAETSRSDLVSEREVRAQSLNFLSAFSQALKAGEIDDIHADSWAEVRDLLGEFSHARARHGFTPGETATFILSLKQPLFDFLRQMLNDDTDGNAVVLSDELWATSILLDKLGLYTTEIYQQSREQIIQRQQEEMLELSTPVVELWEGILALPLIGTLDSTRTQVIMESLLQRIVETGSTIAIIDITGVLTVDTLVAQHLLKTVAAARLMGADCIISGIRPQIAQTIVQLGIELHEVSTKATMAAALNTALQRLGYTIVRRGKE
ncbi:MAG: STAS domain-containing protein [Caldilineaceae bacterium]